MGKIIRHPKAGQAAAARLEQLKQRVIADRERAIASLSAAAAQLDALCAQRETPELRRIAAECAVFLLALKSLDPEMVDEALPDQLRVMAQKLMEGISLVAGFVPGGM